METNVPTGIPFVYELDENFKATREREVRKIRAARSSGQEETKVPLKRKQQ